MATYGQDKKSTATGHRRAIHRDVTLSAMAGPIRFAVPIVGYLILYPLLLNKGGLAVLGIWSLMSTIASYVSAADAGFSLLLTREAGRDRSPDMLREVRRDYAAAGRLYAVLGSGLLILLFVVGDRLFEPIAGSYSTQALLYSGLGLVIAATIRLFAQLEAAVLSARNDYFAVHMVSSVIPAFPILSTGIGALFGRPIEGLAVGALAAAAVQFSVYRWRLRRRHAEWAAVRTDLPWSATAARLRSLLRRSGRFYAISVGFVVREPLFRAVIGAMLGPETVGVYDIALRATATVRDVVAGGFASLLPSLALFHRTGMRRESIQTVSVSLLFLLAVGTVGLGLLMMVANVVFTLWLGEVPQGLIAATLILALANALTLINVPFYHLLLATGHESANALALWLHTAIVLLLIPFGSVWKLDLYGMLVFWTLAAVPAEVLMSYFVEKHLLMFLGVVLRVRTALVLAASVSFLAVSWHLSYRLQWPDIDWSVAMTAMTILTVYVGFALVVAWRPVREFVRMGVGAGRAR